MLHISRTQLQQFAVCHHAVFRARVCRFIGEKLPQVGVDDEASLQRQVDAALQQAAGLEIVTEQELVLFVVLAILHGPDFIAREPWALQTLQRHRAAARQGGLAQALMEASRIAEASQVATRSAG